jgi:hypothetical protein
MACNAVMLAWYRYKVPNHRVTNHKVLITKFKIDNVRNNKVPKETKFLIKENHFCHKFIFCFLKC